MPSFTSSNNSSFHPVRRWFYWQPVLFCFLFFALAAGAIAFFLDDLAARANREAKDTSRLLVSTAISVLEEDLSGRMVDYSWWNDMYDQVTDGLDPDWADDNIGSYLQDSFSYAGTYVLSAEGELVYSSLGSNALPDGPKELLGEDGGTFIAAVQDTPMDESLPQTTVAVYRGAAYIVAAAPVTPEDPTEEQLEPQNRPIMFFLRELNQDVMQKIGERYGVSNPRLVFDEAVDGVTLPGPGGAVSATILWDQVRPGDSILLDLIPKFAVVAGLLLIAASTIYFLWIKAALSATEAKSQLLAKMSHELRTPLNPILGFSQMMIGETVGPISPIYRGYAVDIHKSASHLRNVIDGLLDFSKIEAGKLLIREEPVDLRAVIDSVIQIVGPVSRLEKGAPTVNSPPIQQSIDEDLPMISGDELRIRQVLINILANAIKFSNGNPVEIRATEKDHGVQITVEDKGIGISRDELAKLFEPFVQGKVHRDSAPTPGTGLGLVISRELMRLHGGSLEMESIQGEGTIVTFGFPASRTLPRRSGAQFPP